MLKVFIARIVYQMKLTLYQNKDIREHISNKDNKEQLEAIINESKKENNSIMTIIQIILQNYNKNYQNILYLLENVTFNSTKFIKNEFENDSVLKSYINNYVVAFEKLYQKGTNIKNIQTQKITQNFMENPMKIKYLSVV